MAFVRSFRLGFGLVSRIASCSVAAAAVAIGRSDAATTRDASSEATITDLIVIMSFGHCQYFITISVQMINVSEELRLRLLMTFCSRRRL